MQEYFGEEIWAVLAALPQWKINQMAIREYRACRYERNVVRG
jgi:hypothetical protein